MSTSPEISSDEIEFKYRKIPHNWEKAKRLFPESAGYEAVLVVLDEHNNGQMRRLRAIEEFTADHYNAYAHKVNVPLTTQQIRQWTIENGIKGDGTFWGFIARGGKENKPDGWVWDYASDDAPGTYEINWARYRGVKDDVVRDTLIQRMKDIFELNPNATITYTNDYRRHDAIALIETYSVIENPSYGIKSILEEATAVINDVQVPDFTSDINIMLDLGFVRTGVVKNSDNSIFSINREAFEQRLTNSAPQTIERSFVEK